LYSANLPTTKPGLIPPPSLELSSFAKQEKNPPFAKANGRNATNNNNSSNSFDLHRSKFKFRLPTRIYDDLLDYVTLLLLPKSSEILYERFLCEPTPCMPKVSINSKVILKLFKQFMPPEMALSDN